MTRKKGNPSRDSTKEAHTSSEAAAHASSDPPRGLLGEFKGYIKDGLNRLRTPSKDSRSCSPVPPHQSASSTPNVTAVYVAPSDAEDEADLRSVIRDTQQAATRIHPLSVPAISVASAGQDAQADLNAVDDFQDTYLKPLRISDTVIAEIANLHPYAKMALEKTFSTVACDLVDCDPEAALRGHTSSVNSLSQDGTRIFTGSSDKTVRLWDAGTGEPVGEPLRGHTESVDSVSFSPDSTRIVTGSWDKTGWLMTSNASYNHSIFFSSNLIHALRNTSELMQPASNDDRSSTPFVLNDSGCVVGPNISCYSGYHPLLNSHSIIVQPS